MLFVVWFVEFFLVVFLEFFGMVVSLNCCVVMLVLLEFVFCFVFILFVEDLNIEFDVMVLVVNLRLFGVEVELFFVFFVRCDNWELIFVYVLVV